MALTVYKFKNDYCTRMEYAIKTGLSIDYLLEVMSNYNGNKHVEKLLIEESLIDNDIDDIYDINDLHVDAISDYIEGINKILETSDTDLLKLSQTINGYAWNKKLKNIFSNWNKTGDSDVDEINVKLTRSLIDRAKDLIVYLDKCGVVKQNQTLSCEFENWSDVVNFISSLNVYDLPINYIIKIISYIKNTEKTQAYKFFSDFPELSDYEWVNFHSIAKLVKFSETFSLPESIKDAEPEIPHNKIVENIISMIELKQNKWIRPWFTDKESKRPTNYITKKKYKGINFINLRIEAKIHGYETDFWATENQWKTRGYSIYPNERPSKIVIAFNSKTKKRIDEDDDIINNDQERYSHWNYRTYNVFNACQTKEYVKNDFIESSIHNGNISDISSSNDIDNLVEKTKATIHFGGMRAYYNLAIDQIFMPDKNRFITTSQTTSTHGYYSTLLHELVHWTGHQSRLRRKFGSWADDNYAFEELVAELGSVFICADFGIICKPREIIDDELGCTKTHSAQGNHYINHAAYISSWIENNLLSQLFLAANLAEKAVEYITQYEMNNKKTSPVRQKNPT